MTHFLQSQQWRDIKEKLGNKTFDAGKVWFQTTKVPALNKFIGYIPRAKLEDIDWNLLKEAGQKANCVYISIDPSDLNVDTRDLILELKGKNPKLSFSNGIPTHLIENAVIDISKSEDELLANMKQKHRYNLKLSQKNGVQFKIGSSEEMFEEFLKLYNETVKRQNYFGRSENYLRTVWGELGSEKRETGSFEQTGDSQQAAQTMIATVYYEGKALSSWMLFLYEDTIYYPYGGSSDEHKNVMATYTLVWELIKWGKEHNYKYLDLWGIEKDSRGEYDGFSRFKLGFGGDHIIYEDTIDFVIDKGLYSFLKVAQNLREKSSIVKKIFS